MAARCEPHIHPRQNDESRYDRKSQRFQPWARRPFGRSIKHGDIVSGDALAEGAEGAFAFAYSDDSIARPEDGFGEADQGFANDTISGDDGDDLIAGDAAAIAQGDGGEGLFTSALAEGVNLAVFGASEAPVGSDTIDGGAETGKGECRGEGGPYGENWVV